MFSSYLHDNTEVGDFFFAGELFFIGGKEVWIIRGAARVTAGRSTLNFALDRTSERITN